MIFLKIFLGLEPIAISASTITSIIKGLGDNQFQLEEIEDISLWVIPKQS